MIEALRITVLLLIAIGLGSLLRPVHRERLVEDLQRPDPRLAVLGGLLVVGGLSSIRLGIGSDDPAAVSIAIGSGVFALIVGALYLSAQLIQGLRRR